MVGGGGGFAASLWLGELESVEEIVGEEDVGDPAQKLGEGGAAVGVGGQFGEASGVCPGDWGKAGVGGGCEDGVGGLCLAQDRPVGWAEVEEGLSGKAETPAGFCVPQVDVDVGGVDGQEVC